MAIEDDVVKNDDVDKNGDSSKKIIIGSSSDLNLSFGDSLYLHPNDTGGSPIVTIKLIDTENYKISDLYAGAIYAKTASELWNDLKDTYDKVGGSFDAMISLPPYTCQAAKHFEKHNQLIKLMQFLMGLDDNYLAIRSNILTREPLPLVKVAFAIVSGEESHRNITFVGTSKRTATAFAAKTFDKKRHTMDRYFKLVGYPVGYVKRNSTSKPVSSNNTSADVHSNNASSSTTSNSHVSLSNEQLVRLMNLLNDNEVSTVNANWQDLKANKIVGIGKQFNGLYLFDVDNACKIISNNYIVTCFVSKTLWHQRLGHPTDQVLDALKTTLNLYSHSTFDHLCDTCNKAKQTREPFPLSDHKSSKIGELVHLDVWGPYKVTSRDGFSNLKQTEFDSGVTKDLNHKNFFDNENPKRPNDEGRVSSNDDGIELSPDIQGSDDSEATSIDEKNNTHPKGTIPNETNFVNDFYENSEFNSDVEELPVNIVRRSSRQTKLPTSLNDFVIEGKVKYGVEKVVNYANLNTRNSVLLLVLIKVYRLVKSLYGLKQAPRKWNGKLVTVLKENDFVQSVNDHSLFTKSKKNKFIALLVYVDDIVVTVIKTGNDMCLTQRKYCLELLTEYGLLGCKPVSTPMEPNSVLSYIATKDDPLLDNITGYKKLLGKLIYLTHTRPDIAYSVNCLAQYMHSPLKSHLNCALNVLRYLKNAPGKGIRYNHSDCVNNLKGYSLANWAKCLKTRKSITRYCVFFNNCLISWKSKKQNTLSKSSTEVEYRSLSSAAYEIIWIQKLLFD
ncbi:ribonuclease H-like domain-containing protein [Tanacetum coccineum]